MKNFKAVFLKQVLDTLKNKTILIQFLMFPVLVIVMETAIKLENMPEHFFVKLFSVMFIGMAPLTSVSAIISEEKEKNTLRTLMMSGVKPHQYLLAVGGYVFAMCLLGTAVFAMLSEFRGAELVQFIAIMLTGIILSELIGAIIGIFSKNQMSATSLSIPLMMIFAFVPMLSMFNDTIKKFAFVVYSQQISELINGIGTADISKTSVIVIAVNLAVGVILFGVAYRKSGLE